MTYLSVILSWKHKFINVLFPGFAPGFSPQANEHGPTVFSWKRRCSPAGKLQRALRTYGSNHQEDTI